MANETRAQIRRLTALASKPEEQTQYALSLLQEGKVATKGRRSGQQRELIQATLRVLAKRPMHVQYSCRYSSIIWKKARRAIQVPMHEPQF